MDPFLETFEKTLQSFIVQTKNKLDSQEVTLQQYEEFFRQCEKMFPAYQEFVAQLLGTLSAIEQKQEREQKQEPLSVSIREKQAAPKLKLHQGAPKSVLIVDSTEINRVLMSHYFKDLPIKLEFSASGVEAVKRCQSLQDQGKRYDLILMDLQMKDMSGIQMAEQIRVFEKTTPIFAITHLEPSDAELKSSIESGCNRYLSKSLTKEALIEQVSAELFT